MAHTVIVNPQGKPYTSEQLGVSTFPETRHDLARRYGFTYRSVLDGGFINRGGDDLMKITDDGEVVVYAHDASAFFVASIIAKMPK